MLNYYPNAYSYSYVYPSFLSFLLPIVAAVVAIAGGLALYFLFVRKPNRFQGTAARLHDALTFQTFFTERLIRVLYCITVVAIVIYSVILLFSHFFTALLLFVIGNLAARITFEYALLLLVLCRNTQEINRKMGPLPTEPPAPQQPSVPPTPPQPAPQQPTPPQPASPSQEQQPPQV